MEPREVRTAADARRIVKERGLSHVKVGVHDLDGVLRGDGGDQLYKNSPSPGWHPAYPDATVRILPETCREIATEPGNLLFLCEFVGGAEELCPRGTLRRVL